MMKKSLKLDRHIQPISLAPKRLSNRPAQQSISPRRQCQGLALKPIDSNRPQSLLINNLKKDLSNVRQDAQKLCIPQEYCSQTRTSQKLQLINLKGELSHHKQVEEQLRRQVRELKSRLEKQEPKDRYKNDRQKEIIAERISKLQHELMEANQTSQLREDTKAQRINFLAKELEKVQNERNRLATECEKLEEYVRITNTPKFDFGIQCNQDEVIELRRKLHENEREKFGLANRLKDRELQAKKTQEEYQTSIKQRDLKYQNCINEFKKLEAKLGRSKEESHNIMKFKIDELEVMLQGSRQTAQTLRNQNTELSVKLQRAKQYADQQRHMNEDLAARVRNIQTEISQSHRQQVSSLIKEVARLQSEMEDLESKYEFKCRELEFKTVKSQKILQPTEDLHKAKVQTLSLQITINHLNDQLQSKNQQVANLQETIRIKDVYIGQLQKQKETLSKGQLLVQMQSKCRQLCEQQVRMSEDYEQKISALQNQLDKTRQILKAQQNDSIASSRSTTTTASNFDEALRNQIFQNQQLKNTLRAKNQEIFAMKNNVDEWRRKAESLKSQTDIDRLRGMTEQKSIKSHFQITIQNLRSDIEGHKRRYECLQRKVEFKTQEVRKKDEFIQQVIINKFNKPQEMNQAQYIRKQLQKFFSVNYQARLLAAEERIQQLETQNKQ